MPSLGEAGALASFSRAALASRIFARRSRLFFIHFGRWTLHSEGTRTNQDPIISVLRISPEGGSGDTLLAALAAPLLGTGSGILGA